MADRDLQVVMSSGELSGMNTGGTASDNAIKNKGENDAIYQDLAGENAIIKTKYTPQGSAPSYVEGQVFYNDTNGTFDIQGAYADVTLQAGREMHMEVVNNSGGDILNGQICTHDGVFGGLPEIKLAQADTFDNARILGVATHSIADGEKGIITTFGEVNGLNTLGVTTGVPLFLSATTPGAFVETAPSIVSRVGGVIIADASNGRLFVYIINNKNLPSVFGGIKGQTSGNETYSLTTTAQDIINYDAESSIVLDVTPLTGIITLSNDGQYRSQFTAAITFVSSTSTRSITIELYDITGSTILFSYVKNMPRDATEDSLSFNWPSDELVGNSRKMRIKASVAMDVTFNNISFDMSSINIR